MTYMTCQVEIDHPIGCSCDLGKLNGLLLELGEDGRLGKGRHMEDVGPTQVRFSMPHGILLLSFRIHKKPKGLGMSFNVNIPGMNQLMLNWIGILTPMEEEDAFWS